jgi:hypothetical protein
MRGNVRGFSYLGRRDAWNRITEDAGEREGIYVAWNRITEDAGERGRNYTPINISI